MPDELAPVRFVILYRGNDEISTGSDCRLAGSAAAKLAQYGIKTVGDFRRADAKLINKLLTKKGESLYWELHGQPLTKIATRRPMHKAIARGGSIGQSTDDPVIQNAWLVRNVERLIEAMFWHRYACNRLTRKLRFQRPSDSMPGCGT